MVELSWKLQHEKMLKEHQLASDKLYMEYQQERQIRNAEHDKQMKAYNLEIRELEIQNIRSSREIAIAQRDYAGLITGSFFVAKGFSRNEPRPTIPPKGAKHRRGDRVLDTGNRCLPYFVGSGTQMVGNRLGLG